MACTHPFFAKLVIYARVASLVKRAERIGYRLFRVHLSIINAEDQELVGSLINFF